MVMHDVNEIVDLETYEIQNPDSYEGALGGLTRREFLKYCTGVAATLGLSCLLYTSRCV